VLPQESTREIFDTVIDWLKIDFRRKSVVINDSPLDDDWYLERLYEFSPHKIIEL